MCAHLLGNNIDFSLQSKLWPKFFFFSSLSLVSAEASGQNFREVVGEKECNSGLSRKRRREANYDESSLNDQVNIKRKEHIPNKLHLCYAKEAAAYSIRLCRKDGEAPECETIQSNTK